MLYNSGYIVKRATYKSVIEHKIKIGCCDSWPLKRFLGYEHYDEEIDAKCLYSDKGYFMLPEYAKNGFGRSIEVVDDFDLIKRYMADCRKESVDSCVIMIETEIPLRDIERENNQMVVLGWDCIATSYLSFLDEIEDKRTELFSFSKRLNELGLFDDLADAKDFMQIRRQLVKNNIGFEMAFEPILCRCSLVLIE